MYPIFLVLGTIYSKELQLWVLKRKQQNKR